MPRTYRTIPSLTEQDIQRFWSKVDKSLGQGPQGTCWEWQRARDPDGYGRFNVNHSACFPASRVAFFLASGTNPTLQVCHTCDNPPCANPAHLFEGTPKDNAQDMVRKGRSLAGERNPARLHPERLRRCADHHFSGSRMGVIRAHRTPECFARGDRNAARLYPELNQGENNGRAKLTAEVVRAIRAVYQRGHGAALARQHGVSRSTIARIIRGEIWTHV